ncbi:sulfurtransferase TusA family protein [Asaia prunellae]|uniref:sulfurtransferase TusA family protein n=1 Tax=Asaia prunellae TaxID=610245 RepID=UPI000A031D24
MNIKTIDIRDKICPMTTVYVRLALDRSVTGDALEIILHGEETRRNVELLLATLGQQAHSQPIDDNGPSDYIITLTKS